MGHKYQFQNVDFLCYVKQSRNASWINVAILHVKRKRKKKPAATSLERYRDLRGILFQSQKWAGVRRRTIRRLELITYYGPMRMIRDSLWGVTSIIRSSCNCRGAGRVTMSMSTLAFLTHFSCQFHSKVFLNRYWSRASNKYASRRGLACNGW